MKSVTGHEYGYQDDLPLAGTFRDVGNYVRLSFDFEKLSRYAGRKPGIKSGWPAKRLSILFLKHWHHFCEIQRYTVKNDRDKMIQGKMTIDRRKGHAPANTWNQSYTRGH
jgi:hypothetical protein